MFGVARARVLRRFSSVANKLDETRAHTHPSTKVHGHEGRMFVGCGCSSLSRLGVACFFAVLLGLPLWKALVLSVDEKLEVTLAEYISATARVPSLLLQEWRISINSSNIRTNDPLYV